MDGQKELVEERVGRQERERRKNKRARMKYKEKEGRTKDSRIELMEEFNCYY